ncbi:hypothetical protein [Nocardioides sp. AX2bis]|uniref:hypothetical protein n=1 Tax=Nocardioides sp. AX2bis TaxID=2653157 RepID=UPI0012F1C44A|nr:hypothetical protein [Nocardioides sp. AX2bis]VXC18742.1 conserved hypothetical protein [Nocardioides sp. AX2bis]
MESTEHRTWWSGLLDVAGPLDAIDPTDADLVASRVVLDTDLPGTDPDGPPVTLVVSGGAGQVAGPSALAARRGVPLRAVRVTLRDPADLRGNARRVVTAVEAARVEGALADDVVVAVGMPDAEPGADWCAAVDEIAALELAVSLPVEGADPLRVAAWLEAVLDRETPVTVVGGHPLAVLGAVRRAFDGEGAVEVAGALAGPPTRAVAGMDETSLVGVRRWLRGVETCPDGPAVLAAALADLGVRA